MADNHNDDEIEHLDDFDGGDVVREKKGGLAEAWRTKPLLKLFVFIVVIGGVVGVASTMMSPDRVSSAVAQVTIPPDLKEAPGGKMSPYLKQQTDLADKQRTEDALKTGGSALVTPQGRITDIDELQKKNDPLTELKAETERLKREVLQAQRKKSTPAPAAPQPPPQQQRSQQQEQSDDNLAGAMQRQLTQLTDQWKPRGMKSVIIPAEAGQKSEATVHANSSLQGITNAVAVGNQQSQGSDVVPLPKTIIPAGTVNYGQLLTEANSDVPGPIMVQIMSGPFSGARAVGAFVTRNDYLVLHFTLVNFEDKDYPVDAYGLDPDTTLSGMATEVDQRYFTRVVLPAAASFIQGLGDAIGQTPATVSTTGTTTVVTQSEQGFKEGIYKGLSKGATTAGDFFKQEANRTKPLVRVASGTPMGVFFVSTVFEPELKKKNTVEQANNPMNGLSYPSMYGRAVYPNAPMPANVGGGAYGMQPGQDTSSGNIYTTGSGASGSSGAYGVRSGFGVPYGVPSEISSSFSQ